MSRLILIPKDRGHKELDALLYFMTKGKAIESEQLPKMV